MQDPGGESVREQESAFRGLERLRIAQDFHDRIAPEFLVALFELHQIRQDLESKSLGTQSMEIQKVADRLIAAFEQFVDVLEPSNEAVPHCDSSAVRADNTSNGDEAYGVR